MRNRQVRAIARITFECKTPFSIATGMADGLFDTELMRDANGLPTIPGTAIAGVLRHLYRRFYSQAAEDKREQDYLTEDELFGAQGKTHDAASSSMIEVSFAHVHDQNNQSVQGICYHRDKDPILQWIAQSQPITREGVAIDHRGVAKDQAKFDRAVFPRGLRFSLQLAMRHSGSQQEKNSFEILMELIACPLFRIGGRTRSGLGQIQVLETRFKHFKMQQQSDYVQYSALPTHFSCNSGLERHTPKEKLFKDILQISVNLESESFWRIGQGNKDLLAKGRSADMKTWLESYVIYENNNGETKGKISPKAVPMIAASGIKGALAHRVAFHANCLSGNYAEEVADPNSITLPTNQTVNNLFGWAAEDSSNQEMQQGQAGKLWFFDAFLTDFDTDTNKHVGPQTHVKIDRFTGGAMSGALYQEELIYNKGFTFSLLVTDLHQLEDQDKEALYYALQDLAQGRLAIGGGSSKGHGYFQCSSEDQKLLEVLKCQ